VFSGRLDLEHEMFPPATAYRVLLSIDEIKNPRVLAGEIAVAPEIAEFSAVLSGMP